VLRALRVALLGHRDAPDDARCRRLRELAQLRPLQVVDLVAELRQRAGDEREQADVLRDPVARDEPARVGHAEPEPAQQPPLQLRAVLAPRRQRPDRARELADRESRLGLLDALEVPPHLGRP
jgi:hypothetical protein